MLGMINCLELRPMTPTHLHPCIWATDIFNPGPNQQPDGSATAPERRDFPMNVQSTGYFTGETWAPEKRRDRGTSTYRHTRERETDDHHVQVSGDRRREKTEWPISHNARPRKPRFETRTDVRDNQPISACFLCKTNLQVKTWPFLMWFPRLLTPK